MPRWYMQSMLPSASQYNPISCLLPVSATSSRRLPHQQLAELQGVVGWLPGDECHGHDHNKSSGKLPSEAEADIKGCVSMHDLFSWMLALDSSTVQDAVVRRLVAVRTVAINPKLSAERRSAVFTVDRPMRLVWWFVS